jgi:hypothetical protein
MALTPDFAHGEPAPIPNGGPSMHDLVCEDLDRRSLGSPLSRDQNDHLKGIFKERKQYGYDKYGTYLQTDNGRNSRQDALEEAIDLVVYLKQATLEYQADGELLTAYFFALDTMTILYRAIERTKV